MLRLSTIWLNKFTEFLREEYTVLNFSLSLSSFVLYLSVCLLSLYLSLNWTKQYGWLNYGWRAKSTWMWGLRADARHTENTQGLNLSYYYYCPLFYLYIINIIFRIRALWCIIFILLKNVKIRSCYLFKYFEVACRFMFKVVNFNHKMKAFTP